MAKSVAKTRRQEGAPAEPGSQGTLRRPSTKRGEERYNRILSVAEEMFSTRDYHEVSINEIARVAGGSLATIYQWFGNKRELLFAILKRRVEYAGEMLADYRPAGASAAEDVSELVRRFFGETPLRLIRAVLFSSDVFAEHGKESAELFITKIVNPLGQCISEIANRHGIGFILSPVDLSLVILRYARGSMFEVVLDSGREEEIKKDSVRIVSTMINSLIADPEKNVKGGKL